MTDWLNRIAIQKIILGALLFAPMLFAMTVRHYVSSWSILMLLYGLFCFYPNRKVIFEDKVIRNLVVLLTGFFLVALISNTLAGWPRLTIKALGIDIKHFLVIFWLIAIYHAKESWVWFYRSLPFAGILIGWDAINIKLLDSHTFSIYKKSTYNPIYYGGVAAVLSFITISSMKLAKWDKFFNFNIQIGLYFLSFNMASFAALASMTRTAWFVYVVLAVVFLLFFLIGSKKVSKFKFSLLLSLAFIVLYGLTDYFSVDFSGRLNSAFTEIKRYVNDESRLDSNYHFGSNDLRLARWSASIEASKSKPIFGYGSGNGQLGINQLIESDLAHPRLKSDLKSTTNMHNLFFSTLIDKGLLGLIFSILIFAYLGYFFIKNLKTDYQLSLVGILHTTGFFLICLTDNAILVNNPGQIFLPLVFIYLVHLRHLKRQQDKGLES